MHATMATLPAPGRILVIRLDRIGDLVLSTSVFSALRKHFPKAFIAALAPAACRDLVENHPDLDTAILYDKAGVHASSLATFFFARALGRYRFDAALALHPSNRSHWIPYLAGIPVRVGYDRKMPGLLTHRLHHDKQQGRMHEARYALRMLRVFGIDESNPAPVIPIQPAAAQRIEALSAQWPDPARAPWVAIHASASCPSKRWMPERFAQVADKLIETCCANILLIAGTGDAAYASGVESAMKGKPVNLAGKLDIGQTAALLSRCRLLVSNDSGPVHLAAAVGTPVVDIFGRNQAGLSPERWGPLGRGHTILHKEVGCPQCLAHRCRINFLCLQAITTEEVLQAARSILIK